MRIHNWCLCQQDNITSIKILYSLQNNDSSWTVYPTSLEIFHWFGPDFHLFSCIYLKTVFIVFSGYMVIDEGIFRVFIWLITVEPILYGHISVHPQNPVTRSNIFIPLGGHLSFTIINSATCSCIYQPFFSQQTFFKTGDLTTEFLLSVCYFFD